MRSALHKPRDVCGRTSVRKLVVSARASETGRAMVISSRKLPRSPARQRSRGASSCGAPALALRAGSRGGRERALSNADSPKPTARGYDAPRFHRTPRHKPVAELDERGRPKSCCDPGTCRTAAEQRARSGDGHVRPTAPRTARDGAAAAPRYRAPRGPCECQELQPMQSLKLGLQFPILLAWMYF